MTWRKKHLAAIVLPDLICLSVFYLMVVSVDQFLLFLLVVSRLLVYECTACLFLLAVCWKSESECNYYSKSRKNNKVRHFPADFIDSANPVKQLLFMTIII